MNPDLFPDAHYWRGRVHSTLTHLGGGRTIRALVGGHRLAVDSFLCFAGCGRMRRLGTLVEVRLRFRLGMLLISA